MLQQLKERYEKYGEEARKVSREASPMGGLFGWGEDPRKHPCHMAFYEDVERWMAQFMGSDPNGQQRREAASWILTAAAGKEGDPAFWFLYAAHGLCKELVMTLDEETCTWLRDFYDDQYPRRNRLPVQKEVYKLLCKGAGKKAK